MKIAIFSLSVAGHSKSSPFRIRYNTAHRMAEKGHDVTFVTPGEGRLNVVQKDVTSRFKRIYTPGAFPAQTRRGGFSVLDMMFKTYLVLRNKYQVIQVTGGHRPANFVPCFVAKYVKKSLIVDECWEWLGRGGYADTPRKGIVPFVKAKYDSIFDVKLNAMYDDIIVISKVLKQRFKKTANVHVIHGGAETDNLIDFPIHVVRNALNIDTDLFILGMSNVTPMDHEANATFLRSLSELFKQHKNMRLLVTGPDEGYIQTIIRDFRLENNLIYPGWIDFKTYNRYLSACNLFVLPYPDNIINKARWPNKISDYFCLNRPIITNPTGDVVDYFKRYHLGILCKNSSEAYAEAVNQMVEKKKDLQRICRDARKVAEEELSFDGRVEKFLNIFKAGLCSEQRQM